MYAEFENHKNKIGNVTEKVFKELDNRYREIVKESINYLEMLKKASDEEAELHRNLDIANRSIEYVKLQEKDQFYQLLHMKLNSLIEKFKTEIEKPDHKWMDEKNIRCITFAFEEFLNILYENKPNFEQLAERILHALNLTSKSEKVCKISLIT